MNGSDQKFWIGIASAFVLPTLAYVYTQGRTAQSIDQLTQTVARFQSSIDATNERINTTGELARSNNSKINDIEKHLERVDIVLNNQGSRLVVIETKNGLGGR